ncbi:hypothetical protein TNCV_845231 [Trichonephila clavipes]|uniref:Uncharacterized protein n=1 Tax=Trichonephila clavipes TaxID=2585209 RepID=A0A8X6WH01_TRICX|nr:hypothetical protein TNCV_845231 [Trichonephila clavipes]
MTIKTPTTYSTSWAVSTGFLPTTGRLEWDNWRRVIFSRNLDSVSMLITSTYACGGRQDTGPIRQFCREACGDYTRCDSVQKFKLTFQDDDQFNSCQVIYSQFGLAIHQNDHQARRRFVEWAQNEIAVVPDFHKRILFSDEAHFWLNGYVNKQNCRIWSEANPQVYVETPLHPEKLTVWCALWAGGILLQKR